MLHDVIEVKESDIHGMGVFATCDLDEGFCLDVHGYLSSVETIYCFEWDEHTVFEPYPPFKYLNHSDSPNCTVDCDDFGFILEAIRPIKQGEELTIDYGYAS